MNQIINAIYDKINTNGADFWCRNDGNIYAPSGFSTIDVINVLIDYGITKENAKIRDAIQYIEALYDPKSKMYKYSPKGKKLPCVNAKIVNILQRLKYESSNIKESIDNYFHTQEDDGGWRCATVKRGKSPETDASNPGTTLYVLDLLKTIRFSKTLENQINNAVEFLLKHWEIRKPLGPCAFGIGTTFLKRRIPIYSLQYFLLCPCIVSLSKCKK